MADFSALKTAIQNAIRTNGNNEITGQLLQDILLSMVVVLGDEAITNVADDLSTETSQRQNADGTLQGNINAEATARATADAALQNAINIINSNFSNGYVYAGIATPSATPVTGKVFYIATTAGTYTNFGGLTVTKGINILKYNGSTWSQEKIIGIDDYPTAGSSGLALSGGIDAEIKSLVGYYTCGTAAATAAKTIAASAYILLQGGSIKVKFTYKNTAADATLKIGSADAKPLFYGGRRAGSSNSWEAGEVVEIFYDGTNYMANNVMGGGAGDGAFDISVYNAVDDTPTPYNDLAAALGTNGANIPEHLRKGGMSVKFIQGTVQSSDNNYVQFRYMSSSTAVADFTKVANWQGVDDKPTAGSSNMVESGGIYLKDNEIEHDIDKSKLYEVINEVTIEPANINICNGALSLGCVYTTNDLIPKDCSILKLETTKRTVYNWAKSCSIVFVDSTNNQILDKYECNLEYAEDGLYKQYLPIKRYPHDYYIGVLLDTDTGKYVGSSYPTTVSNQTRNYQYDPDIEELTYIGNTPYDLGMKFTYGKVKFINEKIEEIEGIDDEVSQRVGKIEESLYLGSKISLGTLNAQYSGTSSKNYAYSGSDLIIPAGAILADVFLIKKVLSGTGNNCYIALIDVETNEVKQKFQATNFDVPEADGSYKQTLPETIYNASDCYIGVLTYSDTINTVASSYPTVTIDRTTVAWNLGANDVLTNKQILNYEIQLKVNLYSGKTVKQAVEELTGYTSESIQTLLDNNDRVYLAPKDYLITTPINIGSRKSLYGTFGKTRLILSDGCTKAIDVSNAENVIIDGIQIVGTLVDYNYDMNGIIPSEDYTSIDSGDDVYCTYPDENKGGLVHSTPHINGIGNEIGVYVYYSEFVIIQNCLFTNIDGSALRINHTGKSYIKCANINNLFINNCYNGIWCENEHEFTQYNNIKISLCQVGLLIASGNLVFNNFSVTRCRIGVALIDGYNNGHGFINNFQIKHNKIYGLYIKDVDYGENIGELAMAYSKLRIEDSKGIVINTLSTISSIIECVNDVGYQKKNTIVTLCGSEVSPTGNLQIKQTVDFF